MTRGGKRVELGDQRGAEFATAADKRRSTFLSELFQFLSHNKRWWLTPIVVILVLVSGLLVLGGSAPFIYTLF